MLYSVLLFPLTYYTPICIRNGILAAGTEIREVVRCSRKEHSGEGGGGLLGVGGEACAIITISPSRAVCVEMDDHSNTLTVKLVA